MNNTKQEIQEKLAAMIEQSPTVVAFVQGYVAGFEAAKAQTSKQSA